MNSDSHEKEYSELLYEVNMRLDVHFGADDSGDVIKALRGVQSYGYSEDVSGNRPVAE